MKNKYTQKQIKELKSNPYTFQINEKRILFTKDFKRIFWTKYQAGVAPRKILKELNYNLDCFTQKQIDSIVQRIKKEATTGEFTEGYQRERRPKVELPPIDNSEQSMQYLQHEITYLRQEVEFLKKVLQPEMPP